MLSMRSLVRGVTAVLVVTAAASCAAPARRLTTRVVDDRIVLPKRMASISMDGGFFHYEPTNVQGGTLLPAFRFGITERLEMAGLFSLRYAFLDDRPADGRTPRPLSLALVAGTEGIGYSSMEGWILLPVVSVEALKHVGDRWVLSSQASWDAFYVASPGADTPSYNGALHYASRRSSAIGIGAAVIRQLDDHVAVGFGAGIDQLNACVSPACEWVSRGAGANVRLIVRPWHWLTVSGGSAGGIRYRSDRPLSPVGPDEVLLPIQPITVEWLSLFGTVAFYW